MQRDIEHHIGQACRCIKQKTPTLKTKAPLKPIIRSARNPWLKRNRLNLHGQRMQYQNTTPFWKEWKKPDMRAEMNKILRTRMTTVNWTLLNWNLGINDRDTHPPLLRTTHLALPPMRLPTSRSCISQRMIDASTWLCFIKGPLTTEFVLFKKG